MRKYVIPLIIGISIVGCKAEQANTGENKAALYNSSFEAICNIEYNGGEIGDTKVSSSNLDRLKDLYENKQKLKDGTKIDITDTMKGFIDVVENGMISNYINIKYASEFDVNTDNIHSLTTDEVGVNENNKKLADGIAQDLKDISNLKTKDYLAYVEKLDNICQIYKGLPEDYKSIIYNINILKEEVEGLGGSLETGFNVEETKYWWRVIQGEIDSNTQLYTGKSNEELGIIQGNGGMHEEYSEDEIPESTEANVKEEEAEVNGVEAISKSIFGGLVINANAETQPENIGDTEENVDIESDIIVQENINPPEDWYESIIDGGEMTGIEINESILASHVVALNEMLAYENGRYYLDITGKEKDGSIVLLGGFHVAWIIPEVKISEYKIKDFIYWDNNTFKVRAMNTELRDITLTGYINNDIIFIDSIDTIIGNSELTKASVYREYVN